MPPSDEEVRALYERYAPILFHRCRSILGNEEDALDAVQETFARVVRHHESFRRESSPLTWMYRISTNHCLNLLRNRRGRRQKRERHPDAMAPGERFPGAPEIERAEAVRALLDDEDEETRRMVIHLYFDDMTQREVAELMGVSVPTLRKRLRAFLRRARRRLGPAAFLALLLVLP